MRNCCDRFVMIEGEEDSFETWQGLRGPYYTPSVSEDGTLSWTNNGDLQNPANINIKGPPGPGGVPGGTTGQLLAKASDEDFDTEWIDQPEMDAGHVSYDSTEAYDDGTVGKELTTINSALSSLSAVTEIIDTASGAIASFPDGSGLPMRSLLAQINPVQDLHGYDAPWVAGAGKNLINQDGTDTSNGYVHKAYINTSGTVSTATGDWDVMEYASVEPNTTYTISGSTGGSANGWCEYDSSKTMVFKGTALTIPFTFTTGESTRYVRFNRQYSTDTQVQLEKGSSATAYQPFANICPISGWTGLSGERAGVNLWDEEWEVGAISTSTGQNTSSTTRIRSKNYIPVDPEKTFWFVGTGYNAEVLFYDKYKNFISKRSPDMPTAGGLLNQPSNCYFVRFTMYSSYGTTYKNDISINCPSTDTAYHAYTSLPITVSWQTEAGTVYGGTVDVVTGVLTVDRGIVDLSTLTWNRNQPSGATFYRYLATITGATGENNKLVCSDLAIETSTAATSQKNGTIKITSTGEQLVARLDSCETAAAFTTAMSGVMLVYPLATPQTYQLTPQQISTLLGNNTVFVDTGDVSVTYQASIKGYIDKLLAS